MKHLLLALFVCCANVAFAADKPKAAKPAVAKTIVAKTTVARTTVAKTVVAKTGVGDCFKVRRLLKTDATHYWADWSNTCPYTIDAVYVEVGFQDRSHKEMGNGVWPMYFVQSGAHRVTRFSAPVSDFETILVRRITTDSTEALAPDRSAVEAVRLATLPPGIIGDTGAGRVIPADSPLPYGKTKY